MKFVMECVRISASAILYLSLFLSRSVPFAIVLDIEITIVYMVKRLRFVRSVMFSPSLFWTQSIVDDFPRAARLGPYPSGD